MRTYGRAEGVDARLVAFRPDGPGARIVLTLDGVEHRLRLPVPGEHMALNALAALLAGVALGAPVEGLLTGLAGFDGVRRRFEFRGRAAGVAVYDDYAHHPTKVAAQLRAARDVAGTGRVVVAFQPHLYSRTREFAREFGAALGLADEVVVLDVYGAREDPEPGVSGALVAEHVPLPPERVRFVPRWAEVPAVVAGMAALGRPGDHDGRRATSRCSPPRSSWSCRDDPLGARPSGPAGARDLPPPSGRGGCRRRAAARRARPRSCVSCCTTRASSTCRACRSKAFPTLPESDVVGAAAVPIGAPLASIDTGDIADRVAKLPAVALATVKRSWPHTVTVIVNERVPVASAGTPTGVGLVDAGGVVYPGTPPPGLPRLVFGAVGPDDPTTRSALAALATLPPSIRSQVITVDATVAGSGVPGEVTFGLTENRQIVWGSDERAAEKAAVLVPLLTQPGRVFDVTSPDLPTIRR